MVPDIGFLHTGIEKTCEAKFYQQVVPLTDRIDYLCPMTNNLCYVLASGETAGAGNSCARALDPRDAERTHAHQLTPGLAGHSRAGHGRDDSLPLLLPRARRISAHLRERQRTAHDDFLLPHRRLGTGSAIDFFDRVRSSPPTFPKKSTSTKTCSPQSHLGAIAPKAWLISLPKIALPLASTGATATRERRRLGPAPRHALLRLREVQVRSACLKRWRRLRPLHAAHAEMRESIGIVKQALEGMP